LVCPHATIRTKVYGPGELANAPAAFQAVDYKSRDLPGMKYTVQVAPEDCTGCALCVEACPAKDKSNPRHKAINMEEQAPHRLVERENWTFFENLPELDRTLIPLNTVKNSQLLEPLFEFSGACSGCGETPYIKLMTQLFGDRMLIANATGCTSIYGGNLPTTPYSVNGDGRGPAWANSLFEDNAEFGMGFRLTIDKQAEFAAELVDANRGVIGDVLASELLTSDQSTEKGIAEQRARVAALKQTIAGVNEPWAVQLRSLADVLVKRSVWIVGGDGWAYDIGYGGLDHVLASGRNVNVLVLDTQVYSNTGGQSSKATPRAAVARFAAAGKPLPKKDLGAIAMSYGSIYVAQVAMGANDQQTVRAFLEAEAYPGPSLIIAYSHCIAHGINMAKGMNQQKLAVDSGHWPLYRFNPTLAEAGQNPLNLDSKAPKIPLRDYVYNETRYSMLVQADEGRAEKLLKLAQEDVEKRWKQYAALAASAVKSGE
jgi:pyruvate-ferredoxin/flavodoxin oxidoreductase